MDRNNRKDGAGQHLDARALRFAIIFPIMLAAGLVIGGLALSGKLPQGAIPPLGAGPVPMPAFLTLGAALVLALGIGVGVQGARTTLARNLRRVLLGLAMALQLSAATVFAAALVGQSNQAGMPLVALDPQVALMGCGLAAAMGVVLALTFKPDEQWRRQDDAAFAQLLELQEDPGADFDRLAYSLHPRSSVIIMIVLAGLLPGLLLLLVSAWFLLATMLLALLTIAGLCATVRVEGQQLTLKLAGLVPVLAIPYNTVQAAVSLDIAARDYGGWGLRKHSGNESFLAASGAAVVLRMNDGGRAVVGAPNLDVADAVAAILNRRAGKSL